MQSAVENLRFRLELLWGMTKRDVLGKYRGSMFGLSWSVISPLLLLVVFTFAFHDLLGARWPNAEGRAGFAVMVFCGLLLHAVAAEVLVRAPTSISGQSNYVTRMRFPLSVLPLVVVATALFHCLVGLCLLLAAAPLTGQELYWSAALFPVVLVPYLTILVGLSWILAALGVYVRDISQLGGVLSTALLFLSPIFYPKSIVPERFLPLIEANPLTMVVESARALFFRGEMPDWGLVATHMLVGVLLLGVGLWFFKRLRPGFGDVL